MTDYVESAANRLCMNLLDANERSLYERLKEVAWEWRKATSANLAVLWLFNDATKDWEVAATFPPTHSMALGSLSKSESPHALDFAASTDRVVIINDIESWNAHLEGVQYHLASLRQLLLLGTRHFVAIPFRYGESDAADVNVVGVVVLHFRQDNVPNLPSEESLRLMRHVTANSIASSLQAHRSDVLLRLNALAERYLSDESAPPHTLCRSYADRLVSLIVDALKVTGVSIFFRTQFSNEVECIASTGLLDDNDRLLTNDELSKVRYLVGEGQIGRMLETSELIVEETRDETNLNYTEALKGGQFSGSKVYLCPISSHTDSGRALGVIRCVGHTGREFTEHLHGLDTFETQVLSFIARQVGPILRSMSLRQMRERSIAMIRHDLLHPIIMIRGVAEDVQKKLEHNQKVNPQQLMDLRVSAELARNLIGRFGIDADAQRELQIERVFLEGDIVARIAAMLRHLARVEADCQIVFKSFREVPPLFVDRELVERVLWNLLMNAIKYSHRGTTIEIYPRVTAGGVFIDVSNWGVGVGTQDTNRIFEHSFRGENAARKKMGHGLGLYIARKSMELHGGSLNLTSLNSPTIFTMHFPIQLQYGRPKKD